ncbi:aldo/keto reductase [Salinimonas marina]|uniref:Aldo/keto reductase n=1 Tax=Salinimonas marina TaxID=2785918 RepID=A0A7S9DZI1_9ALTE|nr:aldo/keto reductase [Salinimonas marina]QPG06806.1 aldo/keto reductase [Salinimonas marina]
MSSSLALQQHLPKVSRIAYGCMGLGGGWNNNPVSQQDITQAREIIDTALEAGITLFDHADIYTFAKAEEAFGQVLKHTPSLREQMYLQSKCGIRFEDEHGAGRYDFSQQWIQHSVEQSLQRLHCEQLDVLLLHRPDPLMQLDELAETVNGLHQQGKIAQLGVSNMNTAQIAFLQSALSMPIVANQIEMSLAKTDWLDDGIAVNTPASANAGFNTGLLEYCQLHNIQLQAWGCLAQGAFSDAGLNSEQQNIRQTTEYVMQLASDYEVSAEAIVLAFLLRHPAAIQPVIGTTNIERIRDCVQATHLTLTREQWYNLYVLSRGEALP